MLAVLALALTMTDLEAARLLTSDPAARTAADRNGDGRIDDGELAAFKLAWTGRADAPASREARADANGDGALTPAEMFGW